MNVRYPTNNKATLSKLGDATGASQSFFDGRFNSKQQIVDPFVGGYAFMYWVKLPTWVNDQYPEFKEMSQRSMKDFQGVGDHTLNTVGMALGFNPTEEQVAGGISGDQGFSMQYQEFSGSPITSATNFWVSGIRDPSTNVPTYPRLPGVEGYGAKYHTGELLYVVMRPDVNTGFKAIESAVYYTNVMPTKIIGDYLNYSQGSNDTAVLTQDYTGNRWQGQGVLDYAETVIGSVINTTDHADDFVPTPTDINGGKGTAIVG